MISSEFAKEFDELGFTVVKDQYFTKRVTCLHGLFSEIILPRFNNDVQRNRNLIKRFNDTFEVRNLFCGEEIRGLLKNIGILDPVFCGPGVTHYTSNDLTGDSFGLRWHQDYPSMASSLNSLIVWTSLTDCSVDSHSIEVAPGYHKQGVLDGVNSEKGYFLEESLVQESKVLELSQGDILLMSAFLPHRTYVHKDYMGWKLSLSQRFDDFSSPDWFFDNAYRTVVDRHLFEKKVHECL